MFIRFGLLANTLILIMLTGCWDRVEINDISLITGLAIDKGIDKTYRVTLQWSLPKKNTSVNNFSIEGDSIYEIRNKLMEISSRSPAFSHVAIIIIGSELAREGIKELAYDIGRDLQIRRSTYMFVAEDQASKIIRSESPFETTTIDLKEILKMTRSSSTFTKIDYNTFMMDFLAVNQVAFLPIVSRSSQLDSEARNEKGKKFPKVEGMAIFYQGKMIWDLTGEMTKDWLYMRGKIKKGTTTKWSVDGQNLITETQSQSTKLNIKTNNKRTEVDVYIKELSQQLPRLDMD